MSFVLTFIIMFSFWILLSGYFDFLHLFLGVVCSLFVSYISHDLLIDKDADIGRGLEKTGRFLKYLPWLLYEVFKANVDVAYMTLHPKMPIDPGIIKFKTDLKTEFGMVTLANSITLTPGTVTIRTNREGEFIVHAIAKRPAENLIAGNMQAKVKEIEGKDV